MARYLHTHPVTHRPLKRSPANDGRLVSHLTYEMEQAYSARRPLDSAWMEGIRQYASLPMTPVRNQPIPNSPNIEFPLGAIISDSLYAQATDTLFTASPLLTVREMDVAWTEHAKDMQKFCNWMAGNEIGLRFAVDTAAQDDIQLGTGVYYCPWTHEEQNTAIRRVIYRGPRIIPIAPQDMLVPGGSRGDHQQDPWISLRFWYTKGELQSQARSQQWDLTHVKPTASLDQTRSYYEQVNRTSSSTAMRERYEAENVWCYFDYFNDGIDRDLMVTFDRHSKALLSVSYNRYDTRPIETMRYQIRPHLFYGLGVLEMAQPFQQSASDILNHYLLNMMLVNGRMYAARHGTVDDFTRVWPMRIVGVESTDDIKELRLSDVYPSALQGLQQVIQAAERRIGVSGDISSGDPASRMLGTRTPGITTMSAMQAVNRRFSPAFDGIRLNTAAAVRQCLWRYAERVRMGGEDAALVEDHLRRLLGDAGTQRVLELFRQDDFERAVSVEFTAVSASVNKEADRQNALLVMQQLGTYNQQIIGAVMQLTQQNVDPLVHTVARKVLSATNAAMDQFLRTFDQIRNPQRFLVDIDDELAQAEQGAREEEESQQSLVGQIMPALMSGGGAALMGAMGVGANGGQEGQAPVVAGEESPV